MSAAPLEDAAQWRRLDRRMLLVHPVNEIVRFLPFVVGVFFVGRSSDGSAWWHLVGVGVPIVLGLLRYVTTSFRVYDGQIELRRGLLSRNVLTAPLDRVRTVELTSSAIHRLLGLAKVRIGTGSAVKSGDEKFELDSLALAEARAMRAELLHRSEALPAAESPGMPEVGADDVLLNLDLAWLRYAPLTTGGLVLALGALAALNQVLGQMVGAVADRLHLGERAAAVPVWVALVGGVVVFLVVISVLSVFGYVFANWGFTLSRDRGGRSLHVRRGLVTSRETSLDLDRVRGLEIHEPLGLRLARGGRLTAIVTGLSKRESGTAPLVPPAPRSVVEAVGAVVLGEDGPFTVPLVEHGPAAVRRRYLRSLWGPLLVLVALVAGVLLFDVSWLWCLLAAAAVVPALLLARDRARRLGHALTEHYLITRAHAFRGRRDALQRTGIIGWNLRQSWFQRRVGLATLVATTSAGKQAYVLYDVPEGVAVALAAQATPGLLEPFRSDGASEPLRPAGGRSSAARA